MIGFNQSSQSNASMLARELIEPPKQPELTFEKSNQKIQRGVPSQLSQLSIPSAQQLPRINSQTFLNNSQRPLNHPAPWNQPDPCTKWNQWNQQNKQNQWNQWNRQIQWNQRNQPRWALMHTQNSG